MTDKDRTTGARPDDPQRLYLDSLILLSNVRRTLAGLLDRVSAGDASALHELAAKQTELEYALRCTIETEQRFNDWKSENHDSPRSGEIDLDAARHEIGCRLARLRSCCEAD